MPEHAPVQGSAVCPEWSCGGYVYEDVAPFEFEQVIVDGVAYPRMVPPPASPLGDEVLIATVRWLRPEECPEHGA